MTRVQKPAVLLSAVAANLAPLVQDAIAKSVNARMLASKDATKNLTTKFKADIPISDPFHPELCSGNAVKHTMEALPSVSMHILS